jgi:hypothetical protein
MNEPNDWQDKTMQEAMDAERPMDAKQQKNMEFHESDAPLVRADYQTTLWLGSDDIDDLKARWSSIQAQFIDQPRSSVEQAEALVAETLERINRIFTEQQTSLSKQWCEHEDASTEDLRITLQNYRTFLNSILDR